MPNADPKIPVTSISDIDHTSALHVSVAIQVVFVSHTGEVYPSGFLPLRAGNVRQAHLAQIYRESPIFRRLRDAAQLGGKCGLCEFRHVCAGSRARAYAVIGDPMAEEPLCVYEPRRAREGNRALSASIG